MPGRVSMLALLDALQLDFKNIARESCGEIPPPGQDRARNPIRSRHVVAP